MKADHIKGWPGWFTMWAGSIGHRCGHNEFRVTVLSSDRCGCGTLIPMRHWSTNAGFVCYNVG